MSEFGDQLREEVQRIIDEPLPELPPSEPVRIETEGVFDPELLNQPSPAFLKAMDTFEEVDAFMDNPMAPIMKMLTQYFETIRPKPFEPIKSEHKVRIYQLHAEYNLEALERIAAEIEDLLNEGYCCHMPTVVNDHVIMDFSRRKEENDAE